MLPLPVQFFIVLVLSSFNERMARRFEHLHEENRVLREVFSEFTGRKRIPFSDDQRLRLAIKGKELSPAERKACCQIVSPQTLLDWFRRLAAQKYDSFSTPRTPGRPRPASPTTFESSSSNLPTRIPAGATRRSMTRFGV